jgi:hypothetical protein
MGNLIAHENCRVSEKAVGELAKLVIRFTNF